MISISVACPGGIAAETASYHIGNSLTWDLQPGGIEAIAALRGRNHHVGHHIAFARDLQSIWSNPTVTNVTPVEEFGKFTEALTTSRLDAITLQPWHNASATLAEETDRIVDFINLAHTNPANLSAEFYLYTGWPRLDWLRTQWPRTVPNSDDTLSTTSREYFQILASRVRRLTGAEVYIIPVGEVFYRIDQRIEANDFPELTGISNLYRDLIHASHDIGRYIAGVTTYATLFAENPAGLFAPGGYYNSASARFTPELYTAVHDIVWDVVREESFRFLGDYDGSGVVDQVDLDLVLAYWGREAGDVSPQWRFHLPSGTVDQQELDQVLINWGGPNAPARLSTTGVPEPASHVILACALFVSWCFHGVRRRRWALVLACRA